MHSNLPEFNYEKHIPKSMKANSYRVTFSSISIFKEGDQVYKIRNVKDGVLIGHTFHNSLTFNPETLEAHSIVDGRLLATVEKIK